MKSAVKSCYIRVGWLRWRWQQCANFPKVGDQCHGQRDVRLKPSHSSQPASTSSGGAELAQAWTIAGLRVQGAGSDRQTDSFDLDTTPGSARRSTNYFMHVIYVAIHRWRRTSRRAARRRTDSIYAMDVRRGEASRRSTLWSLGCSLPHWSVTASPLRRASRSRLGA